MNFWLIKIVLLCGLFEENYNPKDHGKEWMCLRKIELCLDNEMTHEKMISCYRKILNVPPKKD